MRLESIDLNLLPVLDALLEERHVTRAGQRTGLSQPATSNALRRLRRLFGDPLLVRSGNAMHMTARAEEIRAQLGPILSVLGEALDQPEEFDPTSATGTIRIATTDHIMMLLAPAMMDRLVSEAPGLRLSFRSLVGIDGPELLRDHQLDLLVGVFGRLDPQLERQSLFVDDAVCMMRVDHPLLDDLAEGDPIDIETFIAYDHVRIAASPTDPGVVHTELQRRGLERTVVCDVPNWLSAPYMLERSDALATVSRAAADCFVRTHDVTYRPLPFDLPDQCFDLIWHPRDTESPVHRWIRSLIGDAWCEPSVDATECRGASVGFDAEGIHRHRDDHVVPDERREVDDLAC